MRTGPQTRRRVKGDNAQMAARIVVQFIGPSPTGDANPQGRKSAGWSPPVGAVQGRTRLTPERNTEEPSGAGSVPRLDPRAAPTHVRNDVKIHNVST